MLGKLDKFYAEKAEPTFVRFFFSPIVFDRSIAGLLGPKFISLSVTSLTENYLDSAVPSMLTLRYPPSLRLENISLA